MTIPSPTIPTAVTSSGGNNTIDYNAALIGVTGSGGSGASPIPTDSTGAVDIWDMPSTLKGQVLWFDTGSKSVSKTPHDYPFEPEEATGPPVVTKESFDINASAEQIMKQYAAESQNNPVGFAALQKQLAQAGFYGDSTQVKGGWNIQTEQALATAMQQYLKVSQGAGVAVNFKDFLGNQAVANTEINGNPTNGENPGGSAAAPPTLADPETLALYAQKAAQAALGHNLTTAQVNSFVSSFHEQQTLEAAGKTNGDTVNAADPRAEAINFVTQSDPQGFQQQQVKGYTDAFLDMFTSGQSQAPNINVDPTAVSF